MIIHQTTPTSDVSAFKWWPHTWNCGHQRKHWTDKDIDIWMKENFPQFYPTWLKFPLPIMRCDMFRYFLLKKEGGLYVDMDFVRLAPMEWLEKKDNVTFGWEDARQSVMGNAFMYSPCPNHPFWDQLEEYAIERSRSGSNFTPQWTSGPEFITEYMDDTVDARHHPDVMWDKFLYPVRWQDRKMVSAIQEADIKWLKAHFPEAKAIHLFTNTWAPQLKQILK